MGTDLKESVINEVMQKMALSQADSIRLKNNLFIALHPYSLIEIQNTDIMIRDESADEEAFRMFFIAKNIQGLTKRSLETYRGYISGALRFINKPLNQITTNDIRYYLAIKKERDQNTDTNIDNIRRALSSFFGWLHEEEYIDKNPILKVKKVRCERRIKKSFKDIEIEKLRLSAAGNIRLTALLETMLSTGCRISEVSGMNRSDLDGDEIVIYGKGKKERVVYLNAKARLALERYLKTRDDENEAMFVSQEKPHKRLLISGMGIDIRELGIKAGVPDVHPHRFRRTAATMALNRGMPIDQVQIMLGHENIETTTIYAVSAQEAVKASHKKYIV